MAVIGIDLGTQSLKAVAVNGSLKLSGEAAIAYQPSFPRPGWAEQDPALWLAALKPAIGRALSDAALKASDIKAICVAGQLDGCVGTDNNHQPLMPCIIWMDRRAEAEIAGIDPAMMRNRTGLVLDSTHMAAKMKWARKNLPGARAVRVWHQPVSFITANLCGRAVMDHGLASTTMLYGLKERRYLPALLAAFDIEERTLPEIEEAHSVAGRLTAAGTALTGLDPGTPVIAGTGDDFANVIGAGIAVPGVVSDTLGTAEAIGAVSDALLFDQQGLVETHGFIGGRYFISNPGWLSGGTVTWFLSTFGVGSAADMSAMAGTAPAGSDGLLFSPALSGAMAPRWVSNARGAFYGLSAFHGRAACARAVLEGSAFAMRDVVERLDALGVPAHRIRLSGGGARSRVWAQIRADIARRPVEISGITDAAAVGAAALAAAAAGLADNPSKAAAQMLGPVETIDPDPAHAAVYERGYRRYRTLFDCLEPLYAPAAD